MSERNLVTIDPALEAAESFIPFDGGRTWVGVVGSESDERATGNAPLLLLHGGPGACHDYLESLAALSATGRRVIFYDQQGCGNSDQPRRPSALDGRLLPCARSTLCGRRSAWSGCTSWARAGAACCSWSTSCTRPQGVISAVVASSPASMPLWMSETARQRAALPPDVIEVLDRHEAAGTWDDPEYEAAVQVFYDRHLCRVVPAPEFEQRSFAKLARNPQVYRTMNGPTEFHVVGTLQGWEILTRLDAVDGPVLLTSGRHDEATPMQVERHRGPHPAGRMGVVRAVWAPVARRGARSLHGSRGRLPGTL